MIFVGVDWGEAQHEVCVTDTDGHVVGRARLPHTVGGIGKLHALVAAHEEEPGDVVIGIETPRGLLAEALVDAGYQVYAVNPLATSRYRDRHIVSKAKSDGADAKLLADLVRTDRHNHRRHLPDSDLGKAVRTLARSHKDLIWARQRQLNQLRSLLRSYYPAPLTIFRDLGAPEALAVLGRATTPEKARALTVAQLRSILRDAGRQRRLDGRANEVREALRSPQLVAPSVVSEASGAVAAALVRVSQTLTDEIARLEERLSAAFDEHPDAAIIRSLPGLGVVLGARLLAEFGDAPNRYADAKARRNFAGTSPVTRASGSRRVVGSRRTRNARLLDACQWWAFSSLGPSPGARAFYDGARALGWTHGKAMRVLANKWVGILHGCMRHRQLYDEAIAWPSRMVVAA